jgi:GAF domain-containing protein
VCGTAAEKRQTLRVADVRSFDGHIACDAASRSEIVVPLIATERLLGVLDIDSPELDRFEPADQDGIEQLCAVFVQALERETLTLPDFI